MNIAVVGSSGYISSFLLRRFVEEGPQYTILKIDQDSSADEILDLSAPSQFNYNSLDLIDYVIFTAAISGPDQCAERYDFCWNINVTGTEYFIAEAIKRNCKVLFFSSDAVFGDIPGFVYEEDSKTDAETPYGVMKKHVEDTFKHSSLFKCIRLSYVVSGRDRFVSYCMHCIEHQEKAEVYHPFYRNCIVVCDVIDTVLWMMNHWEQYAPWNLNVAGDELVSRVRIADELNRLMDGKLMYTIENPGELFYKNRPAITQMKSRYLYEYGILKRESFTEKIGKQCKEDMI